MRRHTIMLPSFQNLLATWTLFMGSAVSLDCNNSKAILVDKMCYIYESTRTDWQKAKELCASLGIHLATPYPPAHMKQMMKVILPETSLDCWTGGNDIDNVGRFVWDESNTPINDDIWNKTERIPEQKVGSCLYLNKDRRLDETLCSELKSVLCMYPVPTPAFYFGEKNSFMCHCKEGACDTKGYCNSSQGRCATGWFGEGCQFKYNLTRFDWPTWKASLEIEAHKSNGGTFSHRYLVTFIAMSRSLPFSLHGRSDNLTDDNDKTCVADNKYELMIKLRPKSFLATIRLVAEKLSNIDGLHVYFHLDEIKFMDRGFRLAPNKAYYDIICSAVVDDVVVILEGQITLCSIYIIGEQNFALLQSTSVPGVTGDSISLPVDGRRGPYDSCYEGHPSVGNQTWTLTFTRPKIIHEIIIYRKPKVTGHAHMTGFYVQGLGADGVLLFRYNDDGQNSKKPTVWIPTYIDEPVHQIVISMDNVSEQRHLELCEVEAVGGCVLPEEGIECKYICNNLTNCGGRCRNNQCIKCNLGYDSNGDCILSTDIDYCIEDGHDIWIQRLTVAFMILYTFVFIMGIYIFKVILKY